MGMNPNGDGDVQLTTLCARSCTGLVKAHGDVQLTRYAQGVALSLTLQGS